MKIVLYLCGDSGAECVKKLDKSNTLIFCYDSACRRRYLFKPEITAEELPEAAFDYLIIVTDEKRRSEELVRDLLGKNIPGNKLLEYCEFRSKAAARPIETFWKQESKARYENFILGMSHSFGGFLTCMSKGLTYKFSAPSMDLYYHYLVLQDLCLHYDMNSVKRVIFELPYYIFNYDLTRCGKTFKLRSEYYGYYKEFHNYEGAEEEKEQILKEEAWYELCGRRKSRIGWIGASLRQQYRRLRYFAMKKKPHNWSVEEKKQVAALRPHVWYKEYKETVEENICIWQRIKGLLEKYENIELKVIVFPFCGYFIRENEEAIERNKRIFYENLNISEGQITDCFEIYRDKPEYFSDECHLNVLGAYEFSKKISGQIG